MIMPNSLFSLTATGPTVVRLWWLTAFLASTPMSSFLHQLLTIDFTTGAEYPHANSDEYGRLSIPVYYQLLMRVDTAFPIGTLKIAWLVPRLKRYVSSRSPRN